MLSVNEEDIDKITAVISQLLEGEMPVPIDLPVSASKNELGQLAEYVNELTSNYNSLARFLFAISRGDLDYEAPKGRMIVLQSLKNLQANLRHLTWKTQQVARGDFSQRVDFMGEFSKSFNSMVKQLAEAREELLNKNDALDRISRTDQLTGLVNRRGALEILEKESYRANRSGRPFAIMLADIDHFKRINDTYGHDTGDAVLVAVAKVLVDHVRREDVCSRWGGEEFLVLLAEADLACASVLAERLRADVEAEHVQHDGVVLRTTISAGISVYREGESVESCIRRSDMCLYRAKRAGRNRVWSQGFPDASQHTVDSNRLDPQLFP